LGGSQFKASWANSSMRPYLEKPFTKIELVEWLKVKIVKLKHQMVYESTLI
jgi:hypothetical protein